MVAVEGELRHNAAEVGRVAVQVDDGPVHRVVHGVEEDVGSSLDDHLGGQVDTGAHWDDQRVFVYVGWTVKDQRCWECHTKSRAFVFDDLQSEVKAGMCVESEFLGNAGDVVFIKPLVSPRYFAFSAENNEFSSFMFNAVGSC